MNMWRLHNVTRGKEAVHAGQPCHSCRRAWCVSATVQASHRLLVEMDEDVELAENEVNLTHIHRQAQS